MSTLHRWALVVGLAVASSCSCGDDERPGDAGHGDAGDGAVRDGGRDARVPDAESDAPRADDPGWVPLPGLPEGCVVERATRPDVVFEMRWRPCQGIAGCEEFDGSTAFSAFGIYDGGEGYLHAILAVAGRPLSQIEVLVTATGTVLGAWRQHRYDGEGVCMAFPFTVGGGRAAFGVFYRIPGFPEEHRVYAGELAAIRDVDTPLAVLGRDMIGGGGAFQVMAVSADMLVVVDGFGAIVTADGVRRLSALPGMARPAFADPLSVIGRDAFWTDWSGYGRAAHASIDGDTELFRRVDEGDILNFATDGVDMAWYETHYAANGYDFERIELWAAPYTTDPATLDARKVADVPLDEAPNLGVLGGGCFAYTRSVSRIHPRLFEVVVIRLSDGARGIARFPEGYEVHPIYLSPTELVSKRTLGPEMGVFRTSLDSVQFE